MSETDLKLIAVSGHSLYMAQLRKPGDITRIKDRDKAVKFLVTEYPDVDWSDFQQAQALPDPEPPVRERQVFKRCSCGIVRREAESVTRCSELEYPGCRSETQAKGVFTLAEGCHAVLFHGPGHQSKARCRLTGEHEVHEAEYLGSVARWRGEESTTGYFDEPPEDES